MDAPFFRPLEPDMKPTTPAMLARMASTAKNNPAFLAHWLDGYCIRHEIGSAALCAMLGILPEALTTLALCIGPKPDESPSDYVSALLSGGNRLGVDAAALEEILLDQ
jgi:hypothetical protein